MAERRRERGVIWLLADPEDEDARWLAAALQGRGERVEVVLPEDLIREAALTCRIGTAGVASTLRLGDSRAVGDGRAVGAGEPSLVVNRLSGLPCLHGGSAVADGSYLGEEWRAALAAWLRSLTCPVLNPPRAACLAGPLLPVALWRSIATACGLSARPWHSDEEGAEPGTQGRSVELLCLGGRCLGLHEGTPASVAPALARVARHVGAPLLGATFDRSGEDWTFLEATPLPRLQAAGDRLVEAVAVAAATGSAWS